MIFYFCYMCIQGRLKPCIVITINILRNTSTMIDDAKRTIVSRYGVSNVSKLEEFAHICRPDKYSPVYHEFTEHISFKVGQFAKLLTDHNIQFSANEFIDGHLYRIYIPGKDLLFDFEYYPVVNFNYNYIRVNYNDDMELLYKKLFPEVILETDDVDVWKLNQRADNHFLRDNGYSPIYDKSALRLGLVWNNEIYQSMSAIYDIDNDCTNIVVNASKVNSQVNFGTIILLRYFKEFYDIDNIHIKSNLDNSFRETTYQLMDMKLVDQQCKKKIWWSPNKCYWHIKKEHTNEYVPFYFTERRMWVY